MLRELTMDELETVSGADTRIPGGLIKDAPGGGTAVFWDNGSRWLVGPDGSFISIDKNGNKGAANPA